MFDNQSDRNQVLAELRRRMAATAPSMQVSSNPVSSSGLPSSGLPSSGLPSSGVGAGVLPALAPFAQVLPHGGLPRGGVVSVVDAEPSLVSGRSDSGGANSALLGLLAGPQTGWSAVVGLPEIGLLAAAELGVNLDRVGVVPDPGSDVLHTLSVLADGVDVIAVGEPATGWGAPSRLRVLVGRLRQHGTVLLVRGQWPGADVRVAARHTRWGGIGAGHGRLRDRELTVTVTGRRQAGRVLEYSMVLAGSREGRVAIIDRPSLVAADPLSAEAIVVTATG